MVSKVVFCVFALVVLIKVAASQGSLGNGCGCNSCCDSGTGAINNNNQGFRVISQSAPPRGLAVQSENSYEGPIKVEGKLPFIGSAAVRGCAQSSGCGAICYGCGDECSIGIQQESCGNQGCGCRLGGF